MNKSIVSGHGHRVKYHYTDKGMMTVLVVSGSVVVIMNGKRFILEAGDILNLEAWCPWSMTFLEDDTMVREIYTDEIGEEHDLLEPADCVDVNKEKVNEVTCNNKGIYEFTTEGIKLLMKVGRWQLGGQKEVWEYRIEKDYQLKYNGRLDSEGIYIVKSGKFEVKMEDWEYCTGPDRGEPIHIPPNMAYTLTALSDDCVIQDYNVSCHLFRLLEMVEAAKDYFPEKLKEEKYMDYLFRENKLINFESFEKEER